MPIMCCSSMDNCIDEGTSGGPSNWKIVDGVLTQTSNIYGGAVDGFAPDKPGTYLLPPAIFTPDSASPLTWKNYTVRPGCARPTMTPSASCSAIATPTTTTASRWIASGSTGGW